VTAVRLTHIGGPTVLLELGRVRILTDPTFDPPGRRYRFGWGTSSTKLAGPALPAEDVGPVDAVLLTHDHHADNLDDAGRAFLAEVPRVLTTEAGAARLGGRARGLAPWSTAAVDAGDGTTVQVTATPCRHGPPLSRKVVGDVVGFAVSAPGVGVVWFSGDTVLYDGVREVAGRVDVDLAVLHVGAVRFHTTGPVRSTMTVDDAVELAELLRPRVAIPVHYDGWSHFSEGEGPVHDRLADGSGGLRRPFRLLERGVATDVSP